GAIEGEVTASIGRDSARLKLGGTLAAPQAIASLTLNRPELGGETQLSGRLTRLPDGTILAEEITGKNRWGGLRGTLRLSPDHHLRGRYRLELAEGRVNGDLRGSVEAITSDLTAELKGYGIESDLAARAAISKGRVEVTLTRLFAKTGTETASLRHQLVLRWQGEKGSFTGLDLALGPGVVSGEGTLSGETLDIHLHGTGLPLAPFTGRADVSGLLESDLHVTGSLARPEALLTLEGKNLRIDIPGRPDLPSFGVVAEARWREGVAAIKGRLAWLQDTAIGFSGKVGTETEALALHFEGEGDLTNLADLAELGEDRVSGRFKIDADVGGTWAAPLASGTISVDGGHYESLVAGTVLTNLHIELIGDRDRLTLRNFAAGDGKGGTIGAAGNLDLKELRLALHATLTHFRAIVIDEGQARVSGEMLLAGTIATPRLSGTINVEESELDIPDELPNTIRPIAVTIIDSKRGTVLRRPAIERHGVRLALGLDLTLVIPGRAFARGHGLDAEWRGRLGVTGTTGAPRLDGTLTLVRGTYDVLGKSATLTRGTIIFIGGAKPDPTLDVEAQVSSTDITAIFRLSGTASAPSIELSSAPPLPRDEILARLLFGTGLAKLGAAQGIEVAQAASSLTSTGRDLDVIGKLRRGIGLDRLSLGAASGATLPGFAGAEGLPSFSSTPGIPGAAPATGLGTAPLAPSSGSAAGLSGTAVSAGKYLANGVYVGVSQGLTAGSSSANVTIELTPHFSIDTVTGQESGSGIGFNWKLDY
ncbi:MAG TPA: translocation/assembly module TamB domain-containing protein, partial [Stellaceae bacterium]|nr:translocation/assembly module TamB domain-containing protein [Stellaceae bacterium]